MKCCICGNKKELRLNICFDCAEAESIIADGVDMYELGINKNIEPVQTPLEKLQFLVLKGWKFNPPANSGKNI